MKVVRSEDHRKHFPKGELYGGELVRPFECPERWDYIMGRLTDQGFADLVDPDPLDMGLVAKIHDANYLRFIDCFTISLAPSTGGPAKPDSR